MTNEQNLVSIVNRVVGRESFIISGLNVVTTGEHQELSVGMCNIAGYLFYIHLPIQLNKPTKNNLYFCIKIQKEKLDDITDASINHSYTQLSRLVPYDATKSNLDGSQELDSVFYGLVLTEDNTLSSDDNYEYKYLLAAKNVNGVWQSVNASVGEGLITKNISEFKFEASNILVENKNNVAFDVEDTTKPANVNQSLDWYLQTYYSIDDGDLDA